MTLAVASLNEMLKALTGATLAGIPITHASLHTATPNSSGSNEVTGGTYARKSIAFDAPSGGVMLSSDDVTFDVPAGTTVTHVGLWSAITAGTFLGYMTVSPSEAFGSAGLFTLNADSSITLT